MNWEMLAAIGEIVGAAGVVLSVTYLAIQIREGTRATRLAALQAMSRDIDGVLQSIIEAPGVADLFLRGITAFESIEGSDLPRFNSILERFFRVYENAFYRNKANQLERTVWHGMDCQIRDLLAYPGTKLWWSSREQWFGNEFNAYVAGVIRSAGLPRMYREQHLDHIETAQ